MRRSTIMAASLVLLCATRTDAQTAPATDATPLPLTRHGTALARDTALDRLNIEAAFSRWAIAYDEGRGDVITSLFTPDALLEVRRGGRLVVTERGPKVIVAGALSARAREPRQQRHLVGNVVINTLDADNASAVGYSVVAFIAAEGTRLGSSVAYSARFRKGKDGVWRFSYLSIAIDNP